MQHSSLDFMANPIMNIYMEDSSRSSESPAESDTAVDIQNQRDTLLTQYRQTRQDLRQKIDRNDRRFIRGVVLLGLILGYAFQTDTQILVIFIPLILGFLFTLGIQRWIDVNFLARQCLDIEEKIEIDEFGWETEYGRLVTENRRHIDGPWGSRWDKFPFQVGYAVGFLTYLGFILYSIWLLVSTGYSFWVLDTFDTLVGVAVFYSIFTIVLILVLISERKTRQELSPE